MLRRKFTLRLYPSAAQERMLLEWLRLHRELYNAALAERIDCYRKTGRSIGYNEQQNVLPAIKADRPEFVPLGSHALQATLRRLDRAFKNFFRRVAAGKTPGFPRFKNAARFTSFGFPDPAGWDLTHRVKDNWRLRVGALTLPARGRHRFGPDAAPNDIMVRRRGDRWELSVTLRVPEAAAARERTGHAIRAFDQGTAERLVFDDGETVPNPRWLRENLATLAQLQAARAKCCRGSRRYRQLTRDVAELHRRIANRRLNWSHQTSKTLVATCAMLGTETLAVDGLAQLESPFGAAAEAAQHRETLSAGFSMFTTQCAYKAEEAGTAYTEVDARWLKPTQRCACCGHVEVKALDERIHLCKKCGFTTTRDRNSALVCLVAMLEPDYYRKRKAVCGSAQFIRNRLYLAGGYLPVSGTGIVSEAVASSDSPRETATTTASAV